MSLAAEETREISLQHVLTDYFGTILSTRIWHSSDGIKDWLAQTPEEMINPHCVQHDKLSQETLHTRRPALMSLDEASDNPTIADGPAVWREAEIHIENLRSLRTDLQTVQRSIFEVIRTRISWPGIMRTEIASVLVRRHQNASFLD